MAKALSFRSISFAQWVPFIFVALWSTGFIGAKYGLPYIEPFNFLFIRMLLTLAVFAVLIALIRPSWPNPTQTFHQFVVGSLVHGAYLGGVFAAIQMGMPAGVAAILVSLQPLLTAFLAWSTLGEKVHAKQWLGLALGLVGVSLVLLRGQSLGQFEVTGLSLAAASIALVGISVGTLYQKRFGAGVHLLSATFIQYCATAMWMGLLTFMFEDQIVIWHPELIAAFAWLVLGLSVTAILLLMFMIREGEASKVASYFYLVPPATALEAWWLFDETLSIGAIIGVVITVLGVFLALKPRSRI